MESYLNGVNIDEELYKICNEIETTMAFDPLFDDELLRVFNQTEENIIQQAGGSQKRKTDAENNSLNAKKLRMDPSTSRSEHHHGLENISYCNICQISKMVQLNVEPFGTFKNQPVKKFIWTTKSGFSVAVISYGAIVQSIKVADKQGVYSDVVLGFDDLDSYVNRNAPYFGATVGRNANRIGKAKFTIDGVTYNLAKNLGPDHLHGGLVGFDKVNWQSTVDNKKVIFSYLSKDGEENYPGDVITNVIYEVTDDDNLNIDFIANTTKKTVVNLTHHSYFNLAGHNAGSDELFNHEVTINADKITETTSEYVPTGRFMKVGGTPFDFRVPTRLGDAISRTVYDDNFCINLYDEKTLTFVSRVTHPSSGRYLEVYSNQPGVQFYTGNFLPSPKEQALIGKNGVGYRRHGAICLETQNYPDAVNHQNFPSPLLNPGEIYHHKVSYRFGTIVNDNPHVIVA